VLTAEESLELKSF